jgi:hypothetical protein
MPNLSPYAIVKGSFCPVLTFSIDDDKQQGSISDQYFLDNAVVDLCQKDLYSGI